MAEPLVEARGVFVVYAAQRSLIGRRLLPRPVLEHLGRLLLQQRPAHRARVAPRQIAQGQCPFIRRILARQYYLGVIRRGHWIQAGQLIQQECSQRGRFVQPTCSGELESQMSRRIGF